MLAATHMALLSQKNIYKVVFLNSFFAVSAYEQSASSAVEYLKMGL
jgi:hypothetical protein